MQAEPRKPSAPVLTGSLKRAAIHPSPAHEVPPIMHEVLCSPGQPLDAATRAFVESRFGRDFIEVPLHRSKRATTGSGVMVNEPGDLYELEADRVAQQVMAMRSSSSEPPPPPATAFGVREASLQRKVMSDRMTDRSTDQGLTTGGEPLPTGLARFYQERFGRDFSQVRVHTGDEAFKRNEDVNAYAFTYGNHIWLGHDVRLGPSFVLAHELTHVIQQTHGGAGKSGGLHRTHPVASRRVQRMKFGSGNPPDTLSTKVLVVPDKERPLVSQAINRIRTIADNPDTFPRCHDFFAEECKRGKDTLKKTFDAAVLWKWPPDVPSEGGAVADTPGTNIAYMQVSYNRGVDWLAGALMHELLHNCGAGGGELATEQGGGPSPHRRADLARLYCIGPGRNEVTTKATMGFNKSLNVLFSYRHLIRDWSAGRLQLNAGADISLTGLMRQGDEALRQDPAELGSGMLGLRRRINVWGAERFGGLVLSTDLGLGVDRFRVRAPHPGDKAPTRIGAGAVLQIGARIEFWIPDIAQREGRVSAPSLEVAYRLVQPLTPEAEQIHEFVLGLGWSF
jgi:hypothetical protein